MAAQRNLGLPGQFSWVGGADSGIWQLVFGFVGGGDRTHNGSESVGRSNPIYQLARTFYRSDAVRNLIAMRAQHHRKTTWRTPASDPARDRELNWRLDPNRSTGLPGEFGTHQFDVIHWYTGRYPASVRGSGAIRFYEDGRTVPDTV